MAQRIAYSLGKMAGPSTGIVAPKVSPASRPYAGNGSGYGGVAACPTAATATREAAYFHDLNGERDLIALAAQESIAQPTEEQATARKPGAGSWNPLPKNTKLEADLSAPGRPPLPSGAAGRTEVGT